MKKKYDLPRRLSARSSALEQTRSLQRCLGQSDPEPRRVCPRLRPLETRTIAGSHKASEIKQRAEMGVGGSYRTEPQTRYEADNGERNLDINLR